MWFLMIPNIFSSYYSEFPMELQNRVPSHNTVQPLTTFQISSTSPPKLPSPTLCPAVLLSQGCWGYDGTRWGLSTHVTLHNWFVNKLNHHLQGSLRFCRLSVNLDFRPHTQTSIFIEFSTKKKKVIFSYHSFTHHVFH